MSVPLHIVAVLAPHFPFLAHPEQITITGRVVNAINAILHSVTFPRQPLHLYLSDDPVHLFCGVFTRSKPRGEISCIFREG